MPTKLTKLYDYREFSEPVDLYEFLNRPATKSRKSTKEMLADMKVLYVVKPNADTMVKFGIAGHKEGKGSAWGRLFQYVNQHGVQSDLNQCSGVQLLYLVGNKYNPNVEATDSFVHKKEKYIIDHFKFERQDKKYLGRGRERVFEDNISKLIRLINDTSNKSWDDVETERRKSERLQQSVLNDTDKVVKITSHKTETTGTSKTYYRVHWNRPYVITKKQRTRSGEHESKKEIFTTDEPAKKILNFNGGKEALDAYHKSHPKATFRD